MRLLIQRVKHASVKVDNAITGSIGKGALVFFSMHKEDDCTPIPWLVQKLCNLRMFSDADDKMNLSLKDIGGEILVVSQFTLYASCQKGRRPDFFDTASPDIAEKAYESFLSEVKKEMGSVQSGIFGAYMEVSLLNDGPATFLIEK